ncbi:MAG TPA: hypothetical protein VLE95_02365 [Chlamydiales bacterium]|nr:hypothetical protein [Chlamydiales bacterium]
MRFALTAAQTAFFTQNGYIELEKLPFDPDEIFSSITQRLKTEPAGRDLWRGEEALSRLLLRKLHSPIAHLVAKPVRLGFDQFMSSFPATPCPLQNLFCIQGLILCALFTFSAIPPETRMQKRRLSALGIPPFPTHPANILFVKPHIALDWSVLKSPVSLYIAGYALAKQGVYVHNQKDPSTHALKNLGYEFGDALTHPHHPIIY